MKTPDFFESAEFYDGGQPEISEYERDAATARFVDVVDGTILTNIEYVRFNMKPPYEDSLTLKKRQTSEITFLSVLLKRKQKDSDKPENSSTLPEDVLKSVTLQHIEKDHVWDSVSYGLMIDGAVRRWRGDVYARSRAGGASGFEDPLATLEDINRLGELLAEA